MKNYQLYARILRLHHLPLAIRESFVDHIRRIVVEVIMSDPDLVWC